MMYTNPYKVHKLPQSFNLELPEDVNLWKNLISETLFRNYFSKAIERGRIPEYADYDFSKESINAYILFENAKTIFSNSFAFEIMPDDEIFDCIVETTKKRLCFYKQNKFS